MKDDSMVKKAVSKIHQLFSLDPHKVDPLLDSFYANGTLYVVNKFCIDHNQQSELDLYHLATNRQCFSDSEIGQIAYQLLVQLDHLH